jgi:hypothetical protein
MTIYTYTWASPLKVLEYYLVGDTLPFATFEEGRKALFEAVSAGGIRTKLDDVEIHPTLLEPILRMYLELNEENRLCPSTGPDTSCLRCKARLL